MSTNESDRTIPKPLSAYNLYYRYKRNKIIQATGGDKNKTKKDVVELITSTAGLESYPRAVRALIPPDRLDIIRGNNIRLALEGQLFSKDKSNRLHRKSKHAYQMGFVEVSH